jgi:hypothetical protein
MRYSRYEEFGIAAVLPGLVRSVEILQAEIDGLKLRLNPAPVKNQSPGKGSGSRKWWANATPAQRKKRLAAMEAGKKKTQIKAQKANA